jgi:subtilase family protein
MPSPLPEILRHIDYSGRARSSAYTARGGGGGRFRVFQRSRIDHARKLQEEIRQITVEAERLKASRELAEYTDDVGVTLEIRGEAGFPLNIEALDAPRYGVTLQNVREIVTRQENGVEMVTKVATVFVLNNKLGYLMDRVRDYAQKETAKGHPKNEDLVANVAAIGLAAIEAFWTSKHPLPELDEEAWWEVWIRAGASMEKRALYEQAVEKEAERLAMEIKPGRLRLPEHTILLFKTSRRVLADAPVILNFLSELRHPELTAGFFIEKPPADQSALCDNIIQRRILPSENAPAVCILDTGVNREHPLLAAILSESDHDTVRSEWGKDDHHQPGHGTPMAGLAAYGDLTEVIATPGPVELRYRLESVKILPRVGHNEPEHYGPITQQAMAIAELNAPQRKRVFSLAVTATDAPEFRETGKPSAWSSALDSYAAGYLESDNTKRLICVSAGTVNPVNRSDYTTLNESSSIEDPGQSWNALTVGAFTEKDTPQDEQGNLLSGWQCIAPKGALSPTSSTGVMWSSKQSRHWPLKPDIVLEGGNLAVDGSGFVSALDSLSLLTTHANFPQRLLTTFGATSAATALAAGMAADIQAHYSEFWPETIRALIVHSTRWTSAMTNGVNMTEKSSVARILQRYGHGVPDLVRALASARQRATLVCQDSLQPYEKRDDGSYATRDMMIYKLPWPKSLLQQAADAMMRLRVTLSYFVESNPGTRAVNSKYRYAGCNLRFQVQTPTETRAAFIARVSDAVTQEERDSYQPPDDTTGGWTIGDENRRRGSLHSDIWVGTAANLAQMEHIIVHPVNGWWRLRPQHKRYNDQLRYGLIISVETEGIDIDIYSAISAEIAQPVSV